MEDLFWDRFLLSGTQIEDEDGMVPLEFGIRNNTAESKLIVYVDGPIDREPIVGRLNWCSGEGFEHHCERH